MLSITDLTCQFHETPLFSRLSFIVKAGECLQITGRNGCGKTTLLRTLAGLRWPDEGEIYWENQPIRQTFQYYAQHRFYLGHKAGLKPELTTLENIQLFQELYPNTRHLISSTPPTVVASPHLPSGRHCEPRSSEAIQEDPPRGGRPQGSPLHAMTARGKRERTELFQTLLTETNLHTQSNLAAQHLSVGQQKRLAFTQLSSMRLWILDEPFAGLDQDGINWLQEKICHHLQQNGIVIFTSHQKINLPATMLELSA